MITDNPGEEFIRQNEQALAAMGYGPAEPRQAEGHAVVDGLIGAVIGWLLARKIERGKR